MKGPTRRVARAPWPALPRSAERAPALAALLACTALLFLDSGPVHLWRSTRVSDEDRAVARVLAGLPDGAAVSAQNALVPHLSHRREIRQFPDLGDARTVVLAPLRSPWPVSGREYRARIEALLRDGSFGVVRGGPEVAVLERGAPTRGNDAWLAGLAPISGAGS